MVMKGACSISWKWRGIYFCYFGLALLSVALQDHRFLLFVLLFSVLCYSCWQSPCWSWACLCQLIRRLGKHRGTQDRQWNSPLARWLSLYTQESVKWSLSMSCFVSSSNERSGGLTVMQLVILKQNLERNFAYFSLCKIFSAQASSFSGNPSLRNADLCSFTTVQCFSHWKGRDIKQFSPGSLLP